ncbi:MAG: phosphate ABC transporter ATP-binding protein [Dehalococcoidales bacterium]|jgi:phosphate transport system ATP-binding protein
MTACITIKDLYVYYGGTAVIKGINLNIEKGAVTAIIGPSGCGKTTLLRCLNRLNEMSNSCKVKGSILLDGMDIRQIDPILLRRRVGMVFQRPNPFPMSIQSNVVYGLKADRNRKYDHKEIVKSSLMKAALWDELCGRLKDSALELSLGQQQRLCIARTLSVSPEVILLDEPSSSLDPVSTAQLESTILKMKTEYTQVLVTHNMSDALNISDFLVFMADGRVVEYGETKQVFKNPQQPETKEYLKNRRNWILGE